MDGDSDVKSVIIDLSTGKETYYPEVKKSDIKKIQKKQTGDFSIMGASTTYLDGANKNFAYWESYSQGTSCTVTYRIEGRVNTAFNGYTGGNSVTITRKNTTSNCQLYVKEDSPFGIGTYTYPVRLVNLSNGYDTFMDLTMDHTNAQKKYSGSVSIGFGIGVSAYGTSLGAAYSYDLEQAATLDSSFTKSTTGYGSSTEFPTKIEGRYKELFLPVVNSQFYLHGNMYNKTPSNKIREVDGYAYFDISANYGTGWGLASIPSDRTFSINTWVFK